MFDPKSRSSQSIACQKLLECLTEKQTIKVILETPEQLKKDFVFLKRQLLRSSQKGKTAFLFSDSLFIPFLNCEENIFFGISADKSELYAKTLTLLEECHISPTILKRIGKELTLTQQIELQMIRSIIRQQKTIVIGHLLDLLPEQELYRILTLLHYLTRHYEFSLVIFTARSSITTPTFCDQLIDATQVPLLQLVEQVPAKKLSNWQ